MKTTAFLVILVLCLWASPAPAATYFYVDPDVGGSQNGSADNPWTWLSSSAWTAINSALSSDDVTVYFSAREAARDTDETTSAGMSIQRTNTSFHRLTLDGMSKYNANDSSPSWYIYSGDARFHITAGYPINTGQGTKRNYVTVRGFACEGTTGQAIYYFGGDHVIIEDNECWQSGSPSHGPTLYFEYAYRHDGNDGNGGCTDIIIRRNIVHHSHGEALYIGGSFNGYGVAHHDNVLIEDNTVYNAGYFASEGDGIDIKDDITNLTVRGNTVYNCGNGGNGGISTHSAGIYENNVVHDCSNGGITYSNYWGSLVASHQNMTMRNNVLYNNGDANSNYRNNITITHSPSGTYGGNEAQIAGVKIYNNTLYAGQSYNIRVNSASNISGLHILNNIGYSGAISVSGTPSGTFVNNYNYTSDPLFVNLSSYDFHLQSTSPCIDAGVSLSGFSTDIEGIVRPQGSGWDIGAFEYLTSDPGPAAPAAPTGVVAYPD